MCGQAMTDVVKPHTSKSPALLKLPGQRLLRYLTTPTEGPLVSWFFPFSLSIFLPLLLFFFPSLLFIFLFQNKFRPLPASPDHICCPVPLNTTTSHAAAMPPFIPRIGFVPAFPEYTGPHKVGTMDVELPVTDLESPSPAPDDNISTCQYRIFYPCDPESKSKSINWIPAPQRGYISAYTKFLGAGSKLADFIS